MRTRRLKVYRFWRSGRYWEDGPLPQIRLEGKWLQEAGFAIGTPIEVQVRPGHLLITTRPASLREQKGWNQLPLFR